MKISVSRIIGLLMLAGGLVYLLYGLRHPEAVLPFPPIVTYLSYGIYGFAALALLLAPGKNKK